MRKGTLTLLMTLVLAVLLVVSIGIVPAVASECCIPCHGNLDAVHGNYNHSATLGSGPVVIFADTDHDDAGWVGATPYFDVTVDCGICHNTDLPTIHGDDCATCHTTPYDTLDIWNRGCQQGGCHPSFHDNSTTAHLPFENAFDSSNDCYRCHNQSFQVTQSQCLNCHATTGTGDVTPPVTTSNTQGEYYGPATIDFSITDNGKVGVGRTFYRLDGGTVTAAGKNILITAPGSHQLEFWSKDQYGNTESAPNIVIFAIVEDSTPPTTTSNAQPSYSQGAVITLTATDASSRGVKTTYYRLNADPIQTGTTVTIPATSGTFAYTLAFWSEDWAGNIETEKSVNFTVTSGGGTIRLVWGDSDTNGSPCPGDPGAEAAWTIRRGTTIVATGTGACPNWSGVNNVPVPINTTLKYSVIIDWWDSYAFDGEGDWDQTAFTPFFVTTPGQVIRLSY